MNNEINLLEVLNSVIAMRNGEPVEVVRERMDRLDRRWSAQEEAEDEAGVGEARAEAIAIHAEDDMPRYL